MELAKVTQLMLDEQGDDPDRQEKSTNVPVVIVVCPAGTTDKQIEGLENYLAELEGVEGTASQKGNDGQNEIVVAPKNRDARALLIRLTVLLKPEMTDSAILHLCQIDDGRRTTIGLAVEFVTPLPDTDYHRLRAGLALLLATMMNHVTPVLGQKERVAMFTVSGQLQDHADYLKHVVSEVGINVCLTNTVYPTTKLTTVAFTERVTARSTS